MFNRNQVEIRPNTAKFYLFYRTACFDLFQVILTFTVLFMTYSGRNINIYSYVRHVNIYMPSSVFLNSNCEPIDDVKYVETCSFL
jgi:hypothetical protein